MKKLQNVIQIRPYLLTFNIKYSEVCPCIEPLSASTKMLWRNIDPHRRLQYYLSYYLFIKGAITSIYVCNPVILNTILCCLQLSGMSIIKKRTYNVSLISKVLKNEQLIKGITLVIFYVLRRDNVSFS